MLWKWAAHLFTCQSGDILIWTRHTIFKVHPSITGGVVEVHGSWKEGWRLIRTTTVWHTCYKLFFKLHLINICLQNLLSLLNILHLNRISLLPPPLLVHVLGCFGGSCPTSFPLHTFYRPKDKWRNIVTSISLQRLMSPLLSHTSLHFIFRAGTCSGYQPTFHGMT